MTHEDDEPEQSDTQQQRPDSADSGGNRVVFSLQGAVATSDHSHFHHHVIRPCNEGPEQPVRFKDSRANEQAEKLRDKLRERQLGGAAENVPDTILVPCAGSCGHYRHNSDVPGGGESSSMSSEDLADEVLQRLLSNVTSIRVSGITSTQAVVEWDVVDIDSCTYRLHLHCGKNEECTENVDVPYSLNDLSPGMRYGVSISAQFSTITGDQSAISYFDTHSTEPSQPLPPRPAGATKSSVQVKWNAVNPNGSAVQHYKLLWDSGTGNWSELVQCVERQYKVTGLSAGTNYAFKVSAVNGIGESLKSETGICSTGVGTPTPPTCIYLGQSSEISLTICWSPPSDNGGAEVDGYSVEQETEYGFISVYDGEQQECTIHNLIRSTHYRFRVYSRNIAGQSKPSVVVTFTTKAGLPNPPIKVRVDGKEKSDSVYIAWDPPKLEGDQEILRYNLKVTPVKEGVTPALLELHTTDDTRSQVSGLQPGSLYRVLVTVVTAGGEGPPSVPFTFKTRPVTPTAPAPPTLRTKPGSYSINLQWGEPSYNGGTIITKYTLEMYRGDWTVLYVGNETTALVPDLLPGKSYKYRLRCHNAVGASLYSNTVNYSTGPAPPHPPAGLAVTSKGPYAATLVWQESITHGTPVTQYSVEMCLLEDKFKEVYMGRTSNCVIRDLQAGCTYYCIVKAHSTAGQSAPSEVVTYSSPPAPPDPVHTMQLVEATDTSLTVSWEPPSSAGSELLYYNVCFNGEITRAEECSFTEDGLKSETSFKIRVQAVNTVGAGPFSTVYTVTTGTPLPPSIPPPISLLSHGHNFLKLQWVSVRGVKLYQVDRKQVNESDYVTVYNGNKNTCRVGKLASCTAYDVRVCGVNSNGGTGPWLEEQFTTESVPPPPILKVTSNISKTDVTVNWYVKYKLQESDVFQVFQAHNSDTFTQVYEGKEQQYTKQLTYGSVSNFKIRVKREGDPIEPEYGPFSQTLVVKLKQKEKEESGEQQITETESETDLNSGFNDHQITIFIFLALCLPALLAIVYFISF